jgi:hypothetical protein
MRQEFDGSDMKDGRGKNHQDQNFIETVVQIIFMHKASVKHDLALPQTNDRQERARRIK